MENGGRKRMGVVVGGCLMVDGSSRMRVIIMTDVVYSHFPSHHLFCGGGKPTHSFFALHTSATEQCQAMS